MTEKVSKRKVKIIIDGKALVDDHFSGVGHYAKGICEGLDEIMETDHNLDVRIAVPFKRADRLPKFGFKNIKVAPIPLPMRQRCLLFPRLCSLATCKFKVYYYYS